MACFVGIALRRVNSLAVNRIRFGAKVRERVVAAPRGALVASAECHVRDDDPLARPRRRLSTSPLEVHTWLPPARIRRVLLRSRPIRRRRRKPCFSIREPVNHLHQSIRRGPPHSVPI